MKLISMTDFVHKVKVDMRQMPGERFEQTLSRRGQLLESIFDYAKLLKQPLKLSAFVPCGVDDKPLRKPRGYSDNDINAGQLESYNDYYNQSKKSVLFEGCEYDSESQLIIIPDSDVVFNTRIDLNDPYHTLEDLIGDYNLTLSKIAIKKIGL